MMWLLHISHREFMLSLLVIVRGGVRSVRLTRLLILLGVSIVEAHLLSQGIFVGNGQHLLGCLGVFHAELVNQGRISESLLEEHDDGLVLDLWDDGPFVTEMLDEFPKGLSLLLHDVSQVPVDSWSLEGGSKVVDKLVTQV
jgi:hypothetical protein